MSIGQRFEEDEVLEASVQELYSLLGERDTPELFDKPVDVITTFDVPAGGGNSLDRKRVYIDATLYQQIMDGQFKAAGLNPVQIVGRFVDHEHTEIVISQGDNPVDTYLPCHRRALRREHEGVLAILGTDDAEKKINNYEKVIWPALVECYKRDPRNPPKDLWCGVYLDDPDERDEELLEMMARLGVIDARKQSKHDVHYGFGPEHCEDCSMWAPKMMSSHKGALAMCTAVAGLVRAKRYCDLWMPAKGSSPMSAGVNSVKKTAKTAAA